MKLTEEILNQNGFETVNDGDMFTSWKQKDREDGTELYDITLYHKENSDYFDLKVQNFIEGKTAYLSKFVSTVEELTDALKVCGLDEIVGEIYKYTMLPHLKDKTMFYD